MERILEKSKFILELRMGILRYVLVNTFLVVINWAFTPHYWWVFWIMAGWGLGLSLGLVKKYMELKLNE